MKLTAQEIKAIEQAGAKRWTKGGHDRLYIKATRLGLEVEYYKTGNVRNAAWLGEGISNSYARKVLGASVYVDAADGGIKVQACDDRLAGELREQAEAFVAAALADLPEAGPVEAAEDYGAAVEALAGEVVARRMDRAGYYRDVDAISRRFGRGYDETDEAARAAIHRIAGA